MGHSPADRTLEALLEHLAEYDRVVEVGVGRRTDLAGELAARGVAVTATDVHRREVPEGVAFELDDIFDPDIDVYEGADAIYALNLPPELHRPAFAVARAVDADFLFTTLGGDQPTVPVRREPVPGDTVFVARSIARDGHR
ncbi:UPF0146 family protein [Natrialbaceae archaeon GCM10025810]|uniref:UPF0146 family protein n=1 Tax=Halovalidus salilacus TaxID=3075124 RepID=UPI0036154CD5